MIALSLMVIFLYGSMIWYVFPVKEGMSWEGHLGGLITGILFSVFFRKTIAKPEKYAWQQLNYKDDDDPFLKHFDEDGNFIEHFEPEIENEIKIEDENPIKINYMFKKNGKSP
ncbi:MAG: rhomboid family intramembrane serine protease [Gelidibacter sp.]